MALKKKALVAKPEQKAVASVPNEVNENGTLTNHGYWLAFWMINFNYLLKLFLEQATNRFEYFPLIRDQYASIFKKQLMAIRDYSMSCKKSRKETKAEVQARLKHLFSRLLSDLASLGLKDFS